MNGLSDVEIISISAHSDGKHYLALSSDGRVWSWGAGDGGRLGLGDTNPRQDATLLTSLVGKNVTQISAGSTYR